MGGEFPEGAGVVVVQLFDGASAVELTGIEEVGGFAAAFEGEFAKAKGLCANEEFHEFLLIVLHGVCLRLWNVLDGRFSFNGVR